MAWTIDKPDDYFNTITYSGDGSFPSSKTGVGFAPDFIWIKRRNIAASHVLSDIIRGTTKALYSETTSAELTSNTYGWVSSFNSDGFSVDQSGSSGENVNASGSTYVAWNWLAGGTASSNTDGSTNTVVSANTTSGFSIVTYSGNSTAGSTFGHGLGVKPSMIITKARTRLSMWNVYHKGLTNYTKGIYLNATDAEFDGGAFADGEPNANTFTLSNGTHVNGSGETYVAYCFAEKQGYSKFGSYTGNGNADGTFVYTGFSPAFVLMKGTNVNGWLIIDNKRTAYNSDSKFLYPQASDVEEALSGRFDFTSNGFKLRNSWTAFNSSGQTYIYMAFAENPFVTSTGVPATAR